MQCDIPNNIQEIQQILPDCFVCTHAEIDKVTK